MCLFVDVLMSLLAYLLIGLFAYLLMSLFAYLLMSLLAYLLICLYSFLYVERSAALSLSNVSKHHLFQTALSGAKPLSICKTLQCF